MTKDLDFLVYPNFAEDIIIGKPSLDDLGFTSSKHRIELQAYGIETPTVLPPDVPAGSGGERSLRRVAHHNIQPQGGQ